MRIRSFDVTPAEEVIVKVNREALLLCGIDIGEEDAAFDALSVTHAFSDEEPLSVRTTMLLKHPDGTTERHTAERTARAGENPRAEKHRLVKLNLYELLRDRFGFSPAPWGILYGVRPSKIVHRCLDDGQSREEIIARFAEDYRVSGAKAALLVDSSIYQRPFLATARPDLVSVYVGIPFCLSRCLYCSFPSFVLPRRRTLDRFMEVFFRDLAAVREAVQRYRFRVQNIYIGGGTPKPP